MLQHLHTTQKARKNGGNPPETMPENPAMCNTEIRQLAVRLKPRKRFVAGTAKKVLTWPMANLLNFWGLHI